ncbi:hypothetical protein [Paenibacillus agricola]|uniref:Phage protein n=1 Tax=Paenibacillus agricola TaxID=2716264 RepID=A0ABX0J586_9BACL|nr:hypothetical protein [Paenibacillus agricola]NHN31133.1 hypothetical protein [Paenibacillus agricola]
MAIIPLKQTIQITPANGIDEWGEPAPGVPFTLKARVTETTKVVATQSEGNKTAEEAVATLRIILDKLADVSYDDVITYTNELDVTVARKPLKIEIKRMLSGKAIVTEVFV